MQDAPGLFHALRIFVGTVGEENDAKCQAEGVGQGVRLQGIQSFHDFEDISINNFQ
jgi:hypothetical protein